ncbi:MAG: hypothetical protein ACI84A_000482 [Pontimonas sp.]
MTNPHTGQPLTRRELRALAEQAVAPPTPAPAYGAIPPVAPEPQYVLSAETLRSVIAPPTPPPAPAPPPALSRREMREREQQASGLGPQYPPTDAVPPSHFSPLAELVQPSAPPFVPPAPPLPPVFGGNSPTDIPFTDAAPYFGPSRNVGDVPITTSSLILPDQPLIDMAGPLGSTGEIIVTGQILMPAQLSETGVGRSQRADRDDDEQFDSYSTGATGVMSRPVGAMQAVSSKGDDTDILLVRRNRWGTGAIVTALASSVLGLAAVALVVLTLMTDALA